MREIRGLDDRTEWEAGYKCAKLECSVKINLLDDFENCPHLEP